MATKITIDANVDSLISQIDKAAARFERFSNSGEKSISEVAASYDKLSDKEKRAFEASKKQFQEQVRSMQLLEKEYEALRQKQQQGITLTKDECKRLREISKEYKSLAASTRQVSNEMGSFSKDLRKTVSAENQIRTKTPQVTHQFDGLKASISATVTAITTASTALAVFGADVDKQISRLQAMANISGDTTEAYYALNDAQRYLGYESDVFNEYSAKLIAVTGDAEKAAKMMRQLGDAAAALGANQQQFDQLVDHFEVMASTDILSDGDIEAIQEIGLLDAKGIVADAFGVGNYDQIEKVEGTGKKAVDALLAYIEKNYSGAMATQRDNIGNLLEDNLSTLTTIAGEIGKELIDAFAIKDLARDMKEVLGDFLGWFREVKEEAKNVGWIDAIFGNLGPLIKAIGLFTAINKGVKLLSSNIKEISEAFSKFQQVNSWKNAFGEVLDWEKVFKFDGSKGTTKIAKFLSDTSNKIEELSKKIKTLESFKGDELFDKTYIQPLKDQRAELIKNAAAAEKLNKRFGKTRLFFKAVAFDIKNFVGVLAGLATRFIALNAVVIIVEAAIHGLSKAIDDFDDKKFKNLYDRASMGEAPLDHEDNSDVIVQAEKELDLKQAIAKAEREALEMSKANIASTDAFAKARREAMAKEKMEKLSTKDYKREFLALEQELDRYNQAIQAKTDKARLDNEIKKLANLQKLYESAGAAEFAHEKQRIVNEKSLKAELMATKQNYAAQELALTQQKEIKKIELAKATNEEEKKLAKDRIDFIDKQIEDLKTAHGKDSIQIKISGYISQMNSDLSRATTKIKEQLSGQNINPKYEQNLASILSDYNDKSSALATAYANKNKDGVMSIGRLLGMTEEEILAKGSTIEQVYETISDAMVNAYAKQATAEQIAFKNAEALKNFMTDYQKNFISGFGDAFSEMVTGAKSAKEAFGDFARSVIQEVVAMIAKLTAMYLLMLLCGFGGKAWANAKALTFGGTFQKKAKGGYITGPGTSRSDSIPAMLSNGEYVLNAAAVNAIGVHRLDQMNKGYLPKFADGGLVGKSNASQPVVSPTVNLTVSALDASSFDNFLRRGGLDKIKQAFYSDNLKFAANTGVF